MVILGVCRFLVVWQNIYQLPRYERFVNGFATVIFISQVKLCIGKSRKLLSLIGAGIAIKFILFPF